jgi:nitrite reductase/ring-hydroxylating ferredoxin subunit
MAFEYALRLDDLPPESMREVVVAGVPILIVRAGDRVYAVGARCTHRGAPLAEGSQRGAIITCPWHGTRWNAGTGRALCGPYGIPGISHLWGVLLPRLPTYRVRIERGTIQVDAGEREAAAVGVRVVGAASVPPPAPSPGE